MNYTLPYINGHFRILDWRYLPYIRPMQGNIPIKYGLIWYSTSILGSWRSPIDIIRCFFDPPLTCSRNFDPGVVSPEIRIARGVEPTNVERLESVTEIICFIHLVSGECLILGGGDYYHFPIIDTNYTYKYVPYHSQT